MSEQYIVSARKYRPQTFDTVVGQQHITETLKNAIRTQQIAHAYLFCGPRGVGKTTCARILAKTLNCTQVTSDTEACGVCDNCVSFSQSSSFNIFELDAASNNKVEDIRNLIEQVRYPPHQGQYKIYIIDEVHMLSTAAFNAFLKTLEEPPSYAIFILATTEKHKILPTILSRCQIFDFKRIKNNDIADHLLGITQKENTQAEKDALHLIARTSEGCMRDALSIMDRVSSSTNGMITYTSTIDQLNLLDADIYFRFIDAFITNYHTQAIVEFDTLLQRGFEGNVILEGLLEELRNILLCKNSQTAQLLDVSDAHRAKYYQYAQRLSDAYIISLMNILHEAEYQYNMATHKRLHVELYLIKCCHVSHLVSVNQLSQEDIDSKKKLNEPAQLTQKVVNEPQPASKPIVEESRTIGHSVNESRQEFQPHMTAHPVSTQAQSSTVPEMPKVVSTPEPTPSIAPVTPKVGSKINSSLLDSLIKKNKTELETVKEILPLNEDILKQTIDEYIQLLSQSGQDLIKNHISLATFSCIDDKNVQCVCTQNLQFSALQNVRQDIVNMLVEKTSNPYVKIIIELDLKEDVVVTKDIMNKNELLQELMSKSPLLTQIVQVAKLSPKAKYQIQMQG